MSANFGGDSYGNISIFDTEQFLRHTNAHRRLGRLITCPIEVLRAIDWDVSRLLGEYQRAVTIIGVDTPWRRFFEGGFLSAYREITLEFFCMFRFLHPQTSRPRQHPGQIQFRLCSELHRMTLLEFGVLLGLYTEEEIDTDLYRLARHEDFDDVIASWWPQISDSPWLGKARVSTMCDPLHRYIHLALAFTLVGRNQR
ncbi:hypothetical protein R6Q57_007547 [Mikania cordata]